MQKIETNKEIPLSLYLTFFEYIPLRLLRKFIFSESFLDRFGNLFPYYKVNNSKADTRELTEKMHEKILRVTKRKNLNGVSLLEIGAGATNGLAYGLVEKGAKEVVVYEPFIEYDEKWDKNIMGKILVDISTRSELVGRVRRTTSLESLAKEKKFDIVISNHVLEHVSKPRDLFIEIDKFLARDSVQVHFVGYIDHFFKYPYHMLLFSREMWNKWLDPGNLSGWRLYDHLAIIHGLGYEVSVEDIQKEEREYEKISKWIDECYKIEDAGLAVTYCTLIVRGNRCIA